MPGESQGYPRPDYPLFRVLFLGDATLSVCILLGSTAVSYYKANRFVLRVQTASQTVVSFSSARFSQHMVLNNNEADSFKTFTSIQRHG